MRCSLKEYKLQELLGFTLPLINYHYVKRKFRSAVDFVSGVKSTAIDDNQIPVLTLSTVCSYCDERPTLPYHIGCAHVFCYYCVKVRVFVLFSFFNSWGQRLRLRINSILREMWWPTLISNVPPANKNVRWLKRFDIDVNNEIKQYYVIIIRNG